MQEFLELRSQISVRHPPVRAGAMGRFSYRGGSVKAPSLINGRAKSLTELNADHSIINDSTLSNTEQSYWESMKQLISNSEFVMMLLAITGFYYVVAGI